MKLKRKDLAFLIESYLHEVEDFDKRNQKDIDKAREKAGFWSYLTGYPGGIAQAGQYLRSLLGIDNIEELIFEYTLPLHYTAVLLFLTLHKGKWEISDSEAKKQMQKVCEYGYRKNKKNSFYISYDDYYYCQPKKERKKTYRYPGNNFSSGLSPADPGIGNMIGQLSITFGKALAKRNSDGTFTVTDQYNFNVVRKNHPLEEAIPIISNQYKIIEKVLKALAGGELGNAARQIEPILTQYETSLNYNGFPVQITTTKS